MGSAFANDRIETARIGQGEKLKNNQSHRHERRERDQSHRHENQEQDERRRAVECNDGLLMDNVEQMTLICLLRLSNQIN